MDIGAKWEQLTRCAAVASLLPVGVYALSAAHDEDARARDRDAALVGGIVCLVAAAVYTQMGAAGTSSALRSADWLLTCPLLVLEMFVLLDASGLGLRGVASPGLALAMAASAGMVLVGWGANPSLSRIGAGVALLLVVAACLAATARRGGASSSTHRQPHPTSKRRRSRARAVVAAFFALWPLYGAVALLRSVGAMTPLRAEIHFNLLDVASKAVFVLVAMLLLKTRRLQG